MATGLENGVVIIQASAYRRRLRGASVSTRSVAAVSTLFRRTSTVVYLLLDVYNMSEF